MYSVCPQLCNTDQPTNNRTAAEHLALKLFSIFEFLSDRERRNETRARLFLQDYSLESSYEKGVTRPNGRPLFRSCQMSGMKKRSERLFAGARSSGWLRFSVMKAPTVSLGELTNSEL